MNRLEHSELLQSWNAANEDQPHEDADDAGEWCETRVAARKTKKNHRL